jgi:hypothetical protein
MFSAVTASCESWGRSEDENGEDEQFAKARFQAPERSDVSHTGGALAAGLRRAAHCINRQTIKPMAITSSDPPPINHQRSCRSFGKIGRASCEGRGVLLEERDEVGGVSSWDPTTSV